MKGLAWGFAAGEQAELCCVQTQGSRSGFWEELLTTMLSSSVVL